MKSKLLMIMAAVLLLSGSAFGQAITIEEADGSIISSGTPVVFQIRLTTGDDLLIDTTKGMTNGYRVYSPQGATWTTATIDTIGNPAVLGGTQFDMVKYLSMDRVTGSGADTLETGFSVMFFNGLPPSWSEISFNLTIGSIPVEHAGKQICIDSCYYPVTGLWKWSNTDTTTGSDGTIPAWGGPYCYWVDFVNGVAERNGDALPDAWTLGQNYPNPFNPTTQIDFDVKSRSDVKLTVFNVLGQQVKTLVNEPLAAGNYSVDWNGTNDANGSVASGIYFYRIEAGDFVDTKKMMLLK